MCVTHTSATINTRFEFSWRVPQPGLSGVQAHLSEENDNLSHLLAALSKALH